MLARCETGKHFSFVQRHSEIICQFVNLSIAGRLPLWPKPLPGNILCYNCLYFIENSYLCSDLGVFSNKCTICINPHAMKCHGVREQ